MEIWDIFMKAHALSALECLNKLITANNFLYTSIDINIYVWTKGEWISGFTLSLNCGFYFAFKIRV